MGFLSGSLSWRLIPGVPGLSRNILKYRLTARLETALRFLYNFGLIHSEFILEVSQ